MTTFVLVDKKVDIEKQKSYFFRQFTTSSETFTIEGP